MRRSHKGGVVRSSFCRASRALATGCPAKRCRGAIFCRALAREASTSSISRVAIPTCMSVDLKAITGENRLGFWGLQKPEEGLGGGGFVSGDQGKGIKDRFVQVFGETGHDLDIL